MGARIERVDKETTEEPIPQFGDPVTFIEAPRETRPASVAAMQIKEVEAQAAAAPIKVKVNAPYRVIHEGKAFVGGQTLTVPNDVIHSRWLDAGWVTKVKGR
jgi:hypothetical protein